MRLQKKQRVKITVKYQYALRPLILFQNKRFISFTFAIHYNIQKK